MLLPTKQKPHADKDLNSVLLTFENLRVLLLIRSSTISCQLGATAFPG